MPGAGAGRPAGAGLQQVDIGFFATGGGLTQLFDTESSTFTYILTAPGNPEAVIIDPVDHHVERDLRLLERLGLKLAYVLETHAHADHVTSAGRLRELTGAKAAVPSGCGIGPAETQLNDGDIIRFGDGETIEVLHTPGHTAGSMRYVWRGNVFTGDTLLIDGCGRTDFQSGSADALYDSVTRKLFALPNETRMWPGHDYNGRRYRRSAGKSVITPGSRTAAGKPSSG